MFTLNTVTCGTSSAPFQATRFLKELAILNSKKEAIEIYHELTEILSQAKFDLRKWSSNEKTI